MNNKILSRPKWILYFCFLLLSILVVYSPSLKGGFVWDDAFLVEDNNLIKSQDISDPKVFQKLTISMPYHERSRFYFRPAQTLSFALDYSLWGLNPLGFRLTNLALHWMCASLLAVLVFLFTARKGAALISGLLFSLSPLNVSAVAYISGRAELLQGLFLLAIGLCVVLLVRKSSWWISGICAGFCLAALLAKESSLFFTLLIISGALIFFRRQGLNQAARLMLLPLICVFGYVIYYWFFLNTGNTGVAKLIDNFAYLLEYLSALLAYLRLALLPDVLYMQHRFLISSGVLMVAGALLCVIVYALSLGVLLRKKLWFSFWGLLWFLAALLPVFFTLSFFRGYFFKPSIMIAEHWLYIPLLGFYAAAAFLFIYLYALVRANKLYRFGLGFCLLAYLLFLGGQTQSYSLSWRDDLSMFRRMIRFAPDNKIARSCLSVVLAKNKNYPEAIKLLSGVTLTNDWDAFLFLVPLGNIFVLQKDYVRAGLTYRAAINFISDKNVIFSSKREVLLKIFKENLFLTYLFQRDFKSAHDLVSAYMKDYPGTKEGYMFFGRLAFEEGNLSLAQEYFLKVLSMDKKDCNSRYYLSLIYGTLGEKELSEKYLRELLEINPDYLSQMQK